MKNRTYNILFHTHTVSGIVISVVLYIIFFAGSFSFFRDEIVNWERNQSVEITDDIQIDFDATLDTLKTRYNLYGRDIEIRKHYIEQRIGVSISASKDTLAPKDAKKREFFYLDTKDYSQNSYQDSYSLGEFLYRLHFLAQVPYPIGYYLSGFIAFFFLFAIITGVLVHWKKITSNFFLFRPLEKLKTLWTDAHTSLGMLGLPFQFIYAVTGAFFMIKLLLVAPNIAILYEGNQTKFYDDLEYSHPHFDLEKDTIQKAFNLNGYTEKTKTLWNDFNVTEMHIFNYGNTNMHVLVNGHLNYKNKFTGVGEAIYKVNSNVLVSKKDPIESSTYLDGVKNTLFRLHFADYGGYALKLISFILGLISCFVIISGVMIWLVARDKKNIPEKKRRFNLRVVRVYLAICLSMYPITALSFIAVKIFHPVNQSFIYSFYFIGWLLLSIFFIIKKDLNFINKYTLLSGSLFGFLIPVVNGITTKNWIWKSFSNQQFQIFFVDTFWLVLSLLTLWISFKLKKKNY
ncbi:PepSY-associated TM helix domain-containing protein [Mariniflexile litorale]|uniref:PepSY-associated TM helix domain-containing protein n=1 Tax=Mariniflexile litorale TaxID=3045158 RepID=A0AAU7ECH1_9FLAO|nr:PepSY-associated TM helix domain-containing protein [Mariniflexile sp. KMM 9835]MDQ8210425.1 PepSY-associated TM helix domain-containing protein [Mariniflexile sp. KMM 9835]